MNKDKKKNKKKGFTLIEVLVVVLIIGILAAIAFPSYTRAVEKSRTREAVQVLSTIALREQNIKLAIYKYTNEVEKLDLSYTNFSDGSRVEGSTFDGKFFDYTVFGEDKQAAFAQRNNGEYTLSVDYLTGELFCRPSSHFVCQELGMLEGPSMSNYDTSNIQNWDLREFINYAKDVLGELWNGSSCGNDLHCMQEETQNLCADDGDGKCLNKVWGDFVTGSDGNKYYWGTVSPNNLALHVNDYAARPFFAQILFRSNGIFLVGNLNHNGRMIDEIAQEMGLTDSNPHGDWVEYRIK